MGEHSLTDRIAKAVGNFGLLLAFFGFVSSVITFVGYELRVLMWIDLWGPLVAWGIRLGLIGGGVALFFVTSLFDKSYSPEARAAEAEAARQAREALMRHRPVQQFLADAAQNLRVVWEPSGDPEAYVVRRVLWQDAQYRFAVDGVGPEHHPDDPRVTNIAVYLERPIAPQRIICTQELATRVITQQDAHPGTWAAFVGG